MAEYKRNRKKKTEEEPPQSPKVNPELEGFNITIDTFGEIRNNFDIDKINEFLNKNIDDKKLRGRDDIPHYEAPSEPEEETEEDVLAEGDLDLDELSLDDGDSEDKEETA